MHTLETENILDVTQIEPGQKHPRIFMNFEHLNEGESFTILNDHDPKPSYYQMLGRLGNIFNWEYLERGPEWWKVKITKQSNKGKDETLGQIAASDLRKAEIFKKYDLDFCCGGKKSIQQACAEKGIDVTKVEFELQQIDKSDRSRPIPYHEWPSGFLADYIVNTHHSYVRKVLPELRSLAMKVAGKHGKEKQELYFIQQLIEDINDEMMAHMIKEERVLFPYIKFLATEKTANIEEFTFHFNSVKHPVNMMEMEHEAVGEQLAQLKELSNNYTAPGNACVTYRLLFKMLEDFDTDMKTHIHLENNILFPKAIELEQKLKSNH